MLCVVALGAAGTGLAYVVTFTVIRDAGATTSSLVTYVIPIFSTLAGVVILKEPLGWSEPLGAAVIVVGALMARDRLHLPCEYRRKLRGPWIHGKASSHTKSERVAACSQVCLGVRRVPDQRVARTDELSERTDLWRSPEHSHATNPRRLDPTGPHGDPITPPV